MSKKTLLSESQIRTFMKLAKLEPLTPGFVQGITENAEDLDEGRGMRMRGEDEIEEMRHARDEDEVDEVRTGLGPDYDLERPKRGHGGGTGPEDGIREDEGAMEEAAHEEAELDATEDELGAEDEKADELEDDLKADDAALAAPAARMVSIDDFLSALESALESAVGEEVEIDADEAELDVADDAEADADALDADADALDADADALDTLDEAAHDEDLDEAMHKDEELEEAAHEDEKLEESANAELVEAITKKVAKKIIMEALSSK